MTEADITSASESDLWISYKEAWIIALAAGLGWKRPTMAVAAVRAWDETRHLAAYGDYAPAGPLEGLVQHLRDHPYRQLENYTIVEARRDPRD